MKKSKISNVSMFCFNFMFPFQQNLHQAKVKSQQK
jgi:hypothetical protein